MPKAFRDFKNRFEKYLLDHPHAKRALQKLTPADCSRQNLILLLRAAANPDASRVHRLVETIAPGRQQIEHVAQALSRCASDLRELECKPLISAVQYRTGRMNIGFDLADSIDEYARHLRLIAKATDYLGRKMSFRAIWKHLPLAMLSHAVRRQDGAIPYSELCYLLEAASWADGREGEFSPDAIRRQYSRLQSRGAQRLLVDSGLLQWFISFAAEIAKTFGHE